jgi:nucleotide-binding universal stress UspA family protein
MHNIKEDAMASLKSILIPIDFSEPSRNALRYGLTLADQFGAKVVIAHVVPENDKQRHPVDAIRQEIHAFMPMQNPARSDARVIVRTGRVEAELLGIVAEEGVDLVVMGTHGRRHPGRWFIGSVTEHILRKVPVPVLTVSHHDSEQHTTDSVALKRILYTTDRSESSDKGLRYAAELARATGAQLTMMHAIYYPDRALWAPGGIPDLDEERVQIGEEMRKSAEAVAPGMSFETLVVEGRPFEKILKTAAERGMDVIVLNLQSKSTVERAFLGSTAERVVRLSPVPVLSIPLVGAAVA